MVTKVERVSKGCFQKAPSNGTLKVKSCVLYMRMHFIPLAMQVSSADSARAFRFPAQLSIELLQCFGPKPLDRCLDCCAWHTNCRMHGAMRDAKDWKRLPRGNQG